MSYKPRVHACPTEKWYSKAMQRQDARLEGTWYRCRKHGQVSVEKAILLGGVPYCPHDKCSKPLPVVSSAMNLEIQNGGWNGGRFVEDVLVAE